MCHCFFRVFYETFCLIDSVVVKVYDNLGSFNKNSGVVIVDNNLNEGETSSGSLSMVEAMLPDLKMKLDKRTFRSVQ